MLSKIVNNLFSGPSLSPCPDIVDLAGILVDYFVNKIEEIQATLPEIDMSLVISDEVHF